MKVNNPKPYNHSNSHINSTKTEHHHELSPQSHNHCLWIHLQPNLVGWSTSSILHQLQKLPHTTGFDWWRCHQTKFPRQIFTTLPSQYVMILMVLTHRKPLSTPKEDRHDLLEEATTASLIEKRGNASEGATCSTKHLTYSGHGKCTWLG